MHRNAAEFVRNGKNKRRSNRVSFMIEVVFVEVDKFEI
jgi:hypothetical protein